MLDITSALAMTQRIVNGFNEMLKLTMFHWSYRSHILRDLILNGSGYFFPSF